MAERPSGFNDKREAPYDHACMNESPVPKNPQASTPSARKSPEICRPVSKRNKPSICGEK